MTAMALHHVPLESTRIRADNASLAPVFSDQQVQDRQLVDDAEGLAGALAVRAWQALSRKHAFVYNSDELRVDEAPTSWEVAIPHWITYSASEAPSAKPLHFDVPLADAPLATHRIRLRVHFSGVGPATIQGIAELPLVQE